jgi:hypothetical protein
MVSSVLLFRKKLLLHQTKEIPMKTPYAILIGLALIAAAIFYREPSIKSALATTSAHPPVMACLNSGGGGYDGTYWFCNIAYGDSLYSIPLDFDNKKVGVTKYR